MTITSGYQLTDFDFELPQKLIAQYPLEKRDGSRLLHLHSRTGQIQHKNFPQLLDWVQAGDVIVFNNTKVMPARLYGFKASGGKIECLIERILNKYTALAHIRASKAPRVGTELLFAGRAIQAIVTDREHDLYRLQFSGEESILTRLMQHGEIPLPPYLKRTAQEYDITRYQTVYAQTLGSVAAPTAGLHFDQGLLMQLQQRGVQLHYVTLHVGAGTFLPIRHQRFEQHRMHQEYMEVNADVCIAVNEARRQGRRIIAVGTTVMRCLETASAGGELRPMTGDTQLFITPGYPFRVADALLTNFHLPKTSLLLLVCAFGGYEQVMQSYQAAIAAEYRFYSYGDAMLVDKSL